MTERGAVRMTPLRWIDPSGGGVHPGGDGDARTRQLMTRENKLALVVGFGLILLVGILISDHFSDGRNRESASLDRAIDPLAPPPPGSPDLIAVAREAGRPGVAPAPAGDRTPVGRWGAVLAARHEDGPNAVRAVEPARGPVELEMGGRLPEGVGLPAAEAARLPYTIHRVKPGESLSSICQERYADRTLCRELAEFNGLADPDALQAGQRLRLPPANDLVRGGRPTATTPVRTSSTSPGPPPPPTYTVRPGDVLSKIAARLLGSGTEYRRIFDLNRDRLDSPDDLRPGMVLRIPRDES